jgi:exodeoxyribonuclease VII small subunit
MEKPGAGATKSSRLPCHEARGDILQVKMKPPPNQPMTFEKSLRRLDEIMAALEKPQVGLDDSLKLFEEGIELLRSASAELGSAETKVQMLIEKSNGRFELREMDL